MPSNHPNRAEHDLRYVQSEKGRASRKRANAKYRATTKGIVAEVRHELARVLLRREPHEGQN